MLGRATHVNGFVWFLVGVSLTTSFWYGLYTYKEKDLRVTLDEINVALKTCTELDYIAPFGNIVCKKVDQQ